MVVATPDVEELRCRGETGRGIVPLQPERVGVDIRLRGGGSIGSGSGRRSLEGHQARRLRSRRVCCRALVSGGSARVAGCRLSILRRCRGAICRSPSGRRSRSARRWFWGAGDRASARSCAIDDLPRVAAKCCDRTGRVEYRASTAQRHAERRAQRPKPAKLAVNPELRAYVQDRLSGACSGPTGASRVQISLAWAASGTAKGPTLGTVLEPGADLLSAPRGLPR